MIARILVKPFGSVWNLKKLCMKKSGFFGSYFRFLYNWYQYEHGSAISFDAKFASVPILPHGTKQIVITSDVKIGKDCVILQQVSIQAETQENSKLFGSPIIGDNCYIYPGAKIIGNISIGNNVVIGANVVVDVDVPDNSNFKCAQGTIVNNGN